MVDSLKPFFSLWVAPRQTIRRLVDADPTRYVIGLAMLSGALGRLEIAWFGALSRRTPLGPLWPVGVAFGAVLGAIVSWLTGRGFGRWLFAAAALLAISGVTRLIEFWITNGTGGVT